MTLSSQNVKENVASINSKRIQFHACRWYCWSNFTLIYKAFVALFPQYNLISRNTTETFVGIFVCLHEGKIKRDLLKLRKENWNFTYCYKVASFIFFFRVVKKTILFEFSLNVFTEFIEFSDKSICHYSKRAQTCHLLCKRPGCYHSTRKTRVRGRIPNSCFSDLSDSLNLLNSLNSRSI